MRMQVKLHFCAFCAFLWLIFLGGIDSALSLHKLAAESVNIIELPRAIFQKKNKRSGPLIAGIVCFWSPLVNHIDNGSFAVTSRSNNRNKWKAGPTIR